MTTQDRIQKYLLSCDINSPVSYRVEGLQKISSQGNEDYEENDPPEIYVECALYLGGVQLGISSKTRLDLSSDAEPAHYSFLTLSSKYRDLTADAQLGFTVWDVSSCKEEVVIGGATLKLFNSKQILKTGQQKLRLWPEKKADGSLNSTTPGKVLKTESGNIERLEKLENKYRSGKITKIDWLDELTFKAIEKIKLNKRKCTETSHPYLIINLCPFEHQVAFRDLGFNYQPSLSFPTRNELVTVWDPEVGKPNPCEHKQVKLARSIERGIINQQLKPNSYEKRELENILKYPPTQKYNGEESQLLWKYRFHLLSDKRALAKFLCCVEWSDTQEAKHATDLMKKWAPIDIAGALELLSQNFRIEEVRKFAVNVLEQANDNELQYYLLQLVQALRYERSEKSHLARFLVRRSARNTNLASFLRWYLMVEIYDPAHAKRFFSTYEKLEESVKLKPRKDGFNMWQTLTHQTELIAQLCRVAKEVKGVRGVHQKKNEKLRKLLEGLLSDLTCFDEPVPLLLNPEIMITGIIPSESLVFKSSLSPLCLTLRTTKGEKCKVIFKKGDDIRQDQLVIQMISLMDRLQKLENVDLHFTPYRILATGQDEGMLEFVPSRSLADILSKHRSIINYLQQYHPDQKRPFGITQACLERFIKSCAGYCVVTYIIGVGDRHLDNLLLCQDGRLFHIDFGYILGHDPKPYPPPMKLCKEMVEAMGGAESEYYKKFENYCCEAYNILRKSSNLILNLFYLMAGANIPDIPSDPERGILKLQENFHLELDDENACQHFRSLIKESVHALFPQMVEKLHGWAQYWR